MFFCLPNVQTRGLGFKPKLCEKLLPQIILNPQAKSRKLAQSRTAYKKKERRLPKII